MKMPSTLAAKIRSGTPTIGTHFMFNDPDVAEIIGDSGLFDYAEYSAEYSSFDMRLLYHMARAAQAGGIPLMLKPDQASQEFWAQAAIGAGFEAVLFTDIRTVEDVERACRAVRPDTPTGQGRMGVKSRRPALSGYDTESYLPELEQIVIAIMIEKDVAVRDLDDILPRARERGVAMTQWGPADFSLSRGEPDFLKSPELRKFEELVIEKSIAHGVPPRIEIAAVQHAKRYVDLGVRHFCIGWDRSFVSMGLAEVGEGMRDIVSSLK